MSEAATHTITRHRGFAAPAHSDSGAAAASSTPQRQSIFSSATGISELFTVAIAAHGARQKDVYDKIIEAHIGMAYSLARRYGAGNPRRDGGDLRQVACVGLVKAVYRFDPEKGHAFAAYAVPTIVGELKRYLRDCGWVIRPPRAVQDLRTMISHAVPSLTQTLGRTPTAAELSVELGAKPTAIDEALTCYGSLRPESLDAPIANADGISRADTLESGENGTAYVETIDALGLACRKLPDRAKRILYLRFFEDRTQRQIGEVIGVTQMQVSRLLTEILGQLREDLVSSEAEGCPVAARPRREMIGRAGKG